MLTPVVMASAAIVTSLPLIVGELKKQNERLSVIAEHLDDAKRSRN
jgi:hypothetical protein